MDLAVGLAVLALLAWLLFLLLDRTGAGQGPKLGAAWCLLVALAVWVACHGRALLAVLLGG